MTYDHKDFWRRYQDAAGAVVQVAVAADRRLPDKLLGVRDGFQRYLREGLSQPVSVSVLAKPPARDAPLPFDDEETLSLARERAVALDDSLGDAASFVVGTETGLSMAKVGGRRRYLVKTWTVVRAFGDEAWGSGGSLQLPSRLVDGIAEADIPFAVPGTRRGGGMVGSLTGGLEGRRSATALATFHALATLFYGVFDSSPGSRTRP